MKMQTQLRVGLMLLAASAMAGCETTRIAVGATKNKPGPTETALCIVWGESLPTRSKSDTPQSATEIGDAYSDFAAACPEFVHLIPGSVQ